jgi:hypothetical protein
MRLAIVKALKAAAAHQGQAIQAAATPPAMVAARIAMVTQPGTGTWAWGLSPGVA